MKLLWPPQSITAASLTDHGLLPRQTRTLSLMTSPCPSRCSSRWTGQGLRQRAVGLEASRRCPQRGAGMARCAALPRACQPGRQQASPRPTGYERVDRATRISGAGPRAGPTARPHRASGLASRAQRELESNCFLLQLDGLRSGKAKPLLTPDGDDERRPAGVGVDGCVVQSCAKSAIPLENKVRPIRLSSFDWLTSFQLRILAELGLKGGEGATASQLAGESDSRFWCSVGRYRRRGPSNMTPGLPWQDRWEFESHRRRPEKALGRSRNPPSQGVSQCLGPGPGLPQACRPGVEGACRPRRPKRSCEKIRAVRRLKRICKKCLCCIISGLK